MSTYQPFPDLTTALAAFAAGRCRRHVRVDGHVIDLVQAEAVCDRPMMEAPPIGTVRAELMKRMGPAEWDARAAALTAMELRRPIRPCAECKDPGCRRSTLLTLTDHSTGEEYRATACEEAAIGKLIESMPLAVPEVAAVDLCRACGRPMIGAVL